MNAQQQKEAVAKAALQYIPEDQILGLGTGSTVDCLIALLPTLPFKIKGVASSSERTSKQVEALGIPIVDLADITLIDTYIDGADEINHNLAMIKGGGGALTREKIVAAHANRFVCIADQSKLVKTLGQFPLPIEVIPMAAHYVMRKMEQMGGRAQIREGFITDNHNLIVDVSGLKITSPIQLEASINQITGVVTNGLFAARGADILLMADDALNIQTLTKK
ncbi:ribose-5-phosphate isomerase RpiA [Ignatzschineria cameli]|uniref:Ribose-5-phosphate isomerase A n=1 Tax=Ignatzschineria cameli TaxID=2182793 RepID=A0A2U2ARD5_9GAMM|nr:ribose-5-phosphate isomerase RpiA [Ignatzschineria cameli]PWD85212.1 ribose 5-phosphate isomerase A [Ignatzschineria cameli]PWD86362.1 ribose 5-phosphate isomerase A [Ignatzschineria cameli]PWD89800.1 ribose 5-phosphate isomerase A [Ignatzschineria cameli]PWD91450.1 ribose 5-phosphate isomerase A [Ignatzschineria cameli]PWD92488.1 ribose 5-phosphate isomerase A [Ignatzschineria cameli]